MTDFDVINNRDLTLKVIPNAVSFSLFQKKQIDNTWNELKQHNKELFDGRSPVVVNISDRIIETTFIDYKTILADRKRPELEIDVSQIGVSGMIVFDKNTKTVFARRSASSAEYPGFFELVPSGNLDESDVTQNTINYTKKIRQEFEEETKIPSSQIKNVKPIGLVRDNNNRIYDVCCLLEVEISNKDLLLHLSNSTEYEAPTVVNIASLGSFVEKNHDVIVPTSKALVSCFLDTLK